MFFFSSSLALGRPNRENPPPPFPPKLGLYIFFSKSLADIASDQNKKPARDTFIDILATNYGMSSRPSSEKFDGVSAGKYTIGLGQTKMSFCDDREGQ